MSVGESFSHEAIGEGVKATERQNLKPTAKPLALEH